MKNINTITFDSIENIRDLGGYKTQNGKTIKYKKLIRSASLHTLSDKEQYILATYGIKNVIDFRDTKERLNEPDKIISNINYLFFPVFNNTRIPVVNKAFIQKMLSQQKLFSEFLSQEPQRMLEVYESLVFEESSTNAYREFFRTLLEVGKTDGAILFHCTAGKDRTGFASALILKCLGVDWDDIMADYLATNKYLQKRIEQTVSSFQLLNIDKQIIERASNCFLAQKEYLTTAFQTIDYKYGSFDNYLKEMNITDKAIERLLELYTE